MGTYTDSTTGTPINYGVQIFLPYGNSSAFFSRFGVPVAPFNNTEWRPVAKYYDFANGKAVSNYSMGAITTAFTAVAAYSTICAQYESLLVPGFWNFPTDPAAIPADLLLPFGEFVKKHSLQPILPWLWATTANGVTDLLGELTIWVMQAFGGQMSRFLLGQNAAVVPASGCNADLYDAVAAFLGDDVLFSTTATRVTRDKDGVVAVVRNCKTGQVTTVHARQLLVAIPPLGGNLDDFDLDKDEKAVFSKMHYTREYAGIASSSVLTPGYQFVDLPAAANDSSYGAWPLPPFTEQLASAGPSSALFKAVLVGDEASSSRSAQALAMKNVNDLLRYGVLTRQNGTKPGGELEWVAFRDHGPMHSGVWASELKSGWMKQFYSLQGRRSTWYTGAAWASPFQTELWEFNEVLLPKMLAK